MATIIEILKYIFGSGKKKKGEQSDASLPSL